MVADKNHSRAMSVAEVADRLGVCTTTARRLIADGELPATKIGRQWRVRPEAVDALLTPQAAE